MPDGEVQDGSHVGVATREGSLRLRNGIDASFRHGASQVREVGGSGTEPARAGNVGTGRAFALEREGGIKGVDVPVLAPAQSRCFVGEVVWGPRD